MRERARENMRGFLTGESVLNVNRVKSVKNNMFSLLYAVLMHNDSFQWYDAIRFFFCRWKYCLNWFFVVAHCWAYVNGE